MKLAEALMLRADLQKKLKSLRERINKNTLIQEGDKPSEDPNTLLEQVTKISGQLKKLIFAINETNLKSLTSSGRPLTEALAERDTLAIRHSIVQGTAVAAAQPPARHGVKEIRWVKTVNVAGLQKTADKLAKNIRELNAEIQEANWQVDLKASD